MENVWMNLPETGRSISEFGLLVVCSAAYLLATGSILFFFIRWFVHIINDIILRQQRTLDEILQLQREQTNMLENLTNHLSLLTNH